MIKVWHEKEYRFNELTGKPYFKHTDGKYYLKGMEDDIKREEKYSEKN